MILDMDTIDTSITQISTNTTVILAVPFEDQTSISNSGSNISQIIPEEVDLLQNLPGDVQEFFEEMQRASNSDITEYVEESREDEVESLPISEEQRTTTILRENPQHITSEETSSRFSSAVWYEKVKSLRVLLAGVGGIGSYVGFLIARLNPEMLVLMDGDSVEAGNLSGQLYGRANLGRTKVNALASFIREYTDNNSINAIVGKFNQLSSGAPIMICGFDNMEARKIFFRTWKSQLIVEEASPREFLFIDGRLSAEEFQIFCIRGDDVKNQQLYESEYLFADEEAEPTICSYKQTSFAACMIASFIVNLFVNFTTNLCEPLIDRELPFLTTYQADTMYLNIQR